VAWDSVVHRVEDAEDLAAFPEREARERVLRVEVENCHTSILRNKTKASVHVPRIFKSHV
jgi:hypothetical protein